MPTIQEEFWSSAFGKEYTDRNEYSTSEKLDAFCVEQFGISKTAMNKDFLGDLKLGPILEVGCNTGNQLNHLQATGYDPLFGIELQEYAVQRAKELTRGINIIQASAFDVPFRDGYFDLVFTAGVLIHIAPDDLPRIMKEMYRLSKKYIWGFEYYAESHTVIPYRGNADRLWKGNFSQLFRDQFPDLKLVKEKIYPYVSEANKGNSDVMYLLEKV